VRSILDEDKSIASAPVLRSVVGEWDRTMSKPIRGAREITLTLSPR
jgi:hypothetical protein